MTRTISDKEILEWIEHLREEIKQTTGTHNAVLQLAQSMGRPAPACDCHESIGEAEALILMLQELYDYRQLQRPTQ